MVGALDRELRSLLSRVEKPGRYVGGEYGVITPQGAIAPEGARVREEAGLLRVAISYPDLYEIGMSNLAVRLIYCLLNELPGVSCERVFAPAGDFEAGLRARGRPLGSLETGSPLASFDVLGFSVGYELTFTNLLNILELGGVAPRRSERGAGQPLVVAGGPAVTNPAPFGPFVDGIFIGEIEGEALALFGALAELKRRGASRADLAALLHAAPYVWTPEKGSPARRVLWTGFGESSSGPAASPFPVPSLRTVQDHGVVEIMRGCPNGCRFCHAGNFYRPFRLKEPARIAREVDELVFGCGYREITLASLSTGDYPDIAGLVRSLTRRHRRRHVSFALPSLRIDSLGLELLSEISAVRKSGLTFAVETPVEDWQRGINKLAPLERTLQIMEEARARGWRAAKFYFMVGLPVTGGREEIPAIIDFLSEVRRRSRLELAANIGTFIPKPHTAFQWAGQLTEAQAVERIMPAKRELAGKGVKVRYHAPLLSLLEGMISRGDGRVGELVWRAFRLGARFDSWEDLVRRDLWQQVLEGAGWDVEAETCRPREPESPLPWDGVRLGVSKAYLLREYRRSLAGEQTGPCAPGCSQPCGVCGGEVRPRAAVEPLPKEPLSGALREGDATAPVSATAAPMARRVLFSFRKFGPAAFLGHLDVLGVLERAFLRAGYEPAFTQGFNPKPRLEFAHPLPLGVESEEEVAVVTLLDYDGPEAFRRRLDSALPPGLCCAAVKALPALRPQVRKHSPMALYWGADYRVRDEGTGLLEDIKAESPAAWTVLERAGDRLRVRVPASAKPSNILKLLENAGCADPLARGLTVTRERCWAKAGSAGFHPDMDVGAKPACRAKAAAGSMRPEGAAGVAGGPVSYFELDLPS
jgi:radical SAM-linked protein